MIPKAEKRILEFEKKAFGMFIHYGLYSTIGKGEWVKKLRNVPEEEYYKAFLTFSAKYFDAEKIARTARSTGMRYITFTARHHDGFSLYDTKGLNTYDSLHAPACGRDLIKELVQACRKYDILPIFYHTTIDWHEKSYRTDFESYLEYLRESIKILCTEYGKIGGFWFDGNWEKPDADWEEDRLYKMVRKYQPDALIINNTGLNALGKVGHDEIDSVTYERGKPQQLCSATSEKHIAGEMCQILNDHWGYAANDLNFKSPKEIIEDLCDCRKYGTNFLLNVGLKGDGAISDIDEALLGIMGKWMDVYGKAVYDTKPCEITAEGNDFVLAGEDGKYYLFVYGLAVSGDPNVVKTETLIKRIKLFNVEKSLRRIRWLDDGEEVQYTQNGDTVSVQMNPFCYGENYIVRVAEIEV